MHPSSNCWEAMSRILIHGGLGHRPPLRVMSVFRVCGVLAFLSFLYSFPFLVVFLFYPLVQVLHIFPSRSDRPSLATY